MPATSLDKAPCGGREWQPMDARDINWFDLSRLLEGTPSQRSAALALKRLRLFELLEDYTPALCGTVPIDCELPSSDLDVVCHAPRRLVFEETLRIHFGDLPDFTCAVKTLVGEASVVCRFAFEGWRVEIVGQDVAVPLQRAFAHMVAEAHLLAGGPPSARDSIRDLKRQGLSTEEAFARLFGLQGDPYDALYGLYRLEILGR